MRQRLFTIAAGVSLLLCMAIGVLWVRSCFIADVWNRQTRHGQLVIRSDHGVIICRRYEDGLRTQAEWRWSTAKPDWSEPGGMGWAGRLGFGVQRYIVFLAPAGLIPEGVFFLPREVEVSQWWAPYWFAAAITAALPLASLFRLMRRRRRLRHGLCRQCGYDLRASTGQCPECGMSIPENVRPGSQS